MDSRNVTAEQAAKIHSEIVECSRYLHRLRERMAQRGFQPDDPLFRRVFVASATLADLTHELHKLAYHGAYGPKGGSNGQSKPR